MKKTALLAIPAVAVLAVAGIVSAYPLLNIEEMTQEQKDLRVQALELRQEMTQDQIANLKGELTQEQFQERLQAHMMRCSRSVSSLGRVSATEKRELTDARKATEALAGG